jgi:hypothetical protein
MRLIPIVLMLTAQMVYGQWVGFPLESNTNAFDWNVVRTNYNPIGQLYSGIVERTGMAGLPAISIVETWTVYAGTNLVATNIGGYTYTNVILLTTNVTTTNAISPFTYTYSDLSGAHTATGFPYLSNLFMYELDEAIKEAIPHFIYATNDAGWYAGWLNTNYPDYFPNTSFQSILQQYNIGIVTNGVGYFSRRSPTTSEWVLAESHYTGAWVFADVQTFNTNYFTTNFYPIIKYIPAVATNPLIPVSVLVTGKVLNVTNQTLAYKGETITLAGTNTILSNYWYDIMGMTPSSASRTGDVLSVIWTNEVPIYGNWEYELDASALDERWYVLNSLRYTEEGVGVDWKFSYTNIGTYPSQTHYSGTNYAEVRTRMLSVVPTYVEPPLIGEPTYSAWINRFDEADWQGMFNPTDYNYDLTSDGHEFPFIVTYTDIQHSADFYLFGGTNALSGFTYYDYIGILPVPDTWTLGTNFAESAVGTQKWEMPQINPAIAFPVAEGSYKIQQRIKYTPRVVIKWDGTNGFKWK